jgi:hypothetical protein
VWVLLARVAAAVESGTWPDPSPDRPQEQSKGDQREQRVRVGPPVAETHESDAGEHPTVRAFTPPMVPLAVRSTRPDPETRPEAFEEAA